MFTGLNWLAKEANAGFPKDCDESSGSLKTRNFLPGVTSFTSPFPQDDIVGQWNERVAKAGSMLVLTGAIMLS